jgi:hypothetical protein
MSLTTLPPELEYMIVEVVWCFGAAGILLVLSEQFGDFVCGMASIPRKRYRVFVARALHDANEVKPTSSQSNILEHPRGRYNDPVIPIWPTRFESRANELGHAAMFSIVVYFCGRYAFAAYRRYGEGNHKSRRTSFTNEMLPFLADKSASGAAHPSLPL